MKTFTGIASFLILSAATAGAQANERDDSEMAICANEVQNYYGEHAEVQLVSKRQYGHGSRLKVAARLDQDNARFATCWITADDVAAYDGVEQGSMVATIGD